MNTITETTTAPAFAHDTDKDTLIIKDHIATITAKYPLFTVDCEVDRELIVSHLGQTYNCTCCMDTYKKLGNVCYYNLETGKVTSLLFGADFSTCTPELAEVYRKLNDHITQCHIREAYRMPKTVNIGGVKVGQFIETGGYLHIQGMLDYRLTRIYEYPIKSFGPLIEAYSKISTGPVVPKLVELVDQLIHELTSLKTTVPESFVALKFVLAEALTPNQSLAMSAVIGMTRWYNESTTFNMARMRAFDLYHFKGSTEGRVIEVGLTSGLESAITTYLKLTDESVFRKRELTKSTDQSMSRASKYFSDNGMGQLLNRRPSVMDDFEAGKLWRTSKAVTAPVEVKSVFDTIKEDRQVAPVIKGIPEYTIVKDITWKTFIEKVLKDALAITINVGSRTSYWYNFSSPEETVDGSVKGMLVWDVESNPLRRILPSVNTQRVDNISNRGGNNLMGTTFNLEMVTKSVWNGDNQIHFLMEGESNYTPKIPHIGASVSSDLYPLRADMDVVMGYLKLSEPVAPAVIGIGIDMNLSSIELVVTFSDRVQTYKVGPAPTEEI